MDERLNDIEIDYHHEEQYADGWSWSREEHKEVYVGISVYVDIKLGLSDLGCDQISEFDLVGSDEGATKRELEEFILSNVKAGLIEIEDKDVWVEAIYKQIFEDLPEDYREYLCTFSQYRWLDWRFKGIYDA